MHQLGVPTYSLAGVIANYTREGMRDSDGNGLAE